MPNRFRLAHDKFDENWALARNISAATFDSSLQHAGWQFIAIGGSFRKIGFGCTEKAAIRRALALAFKYICRSYNAAEVESVSVMSVLGLRAATVEFHTRHLQEQIVLEDVDEKSGRPFAIS